MLNSRRASFFLAVLALFGVPIVRPMAVAANDDLTKEEIAQLVLNRFRENYAPVTTMQATVKTVLGGFKLFPTPLDDAKAGKDKAVADVPPGQARLEVGPLDQMQLILSSVVIAGANQRCEEVGKNYGPLIYLRKGALELKYSPPHFAQLYRFEGHAGIGQMHFDPREAMLWDRTDTMQSLLHAERLQRAEIVSDADGKRVARVVANCTPNYVTILECPEANAFLPTRAFHIDHSGVPEFDGVVMRGVEVTYDRHMVGEKTVLFPKRIMEKNSARTLAGERPHKTEGYMQLTDGQVVTVTVTELKINEKLPKDAFDCPQFAPGTRIGNKVGPDTNRIPANF